MQTSDISKTELTEIVKEAVIALLTERKDLLEDAFNEGSLHQKIQQRY